MSLNPDPQIIISHRAVLIYLAISLPIFVLPLGILHANRGHPLPIEPLVCVTVTDEGGMAAQENEGTATALDGNATCSIPSRPSSETVSS